MAKVKPQGIPQHELMAHQPGEHQDQNIIDVDPDTFDSLVDDDERYGGVGGTLASAGLGFASGATFGLSDVALTKSGMMKPETLRGLQETNPGAHILGEIGSFFAPTGVAGLLGKAGKATYRGVKALTAIRAAEEAGMVTKLLGATSEIGAMAAGSAVEGALYAGTQHTLNEFALGDTDLNAEKILSNYGQGAFFGGAMGAVLKGAALGVPASMRAGSKAIGKLRDTLIGKGHGDESLLSKAMDLGQPSGKLSEQFMNRAKNLDIDQQADLVRGVTTELNTVKNNFDTAIKDLNSTLRPAERDALIETANAPKIMTATQDVLDSINQAKAMMESKPGLYSNNAVSKLESWRTQLANGLKKKTPGGRFDLLKDIKQGLGEWGHGFQSETKAATQEVMKGLSNKVGQMLTNPDIFGMAGASEAAHNELLTKIYTMVNPKGRAKTPLQKEFKKFFFGMDGNFDSDKMKKFLTKYGPEGDRARELLDDWFDLQKMLPDHFENTLANVPNDLWDASKFSKVMDTLESTKGNVQKAQTSYQEALMNAKGKKLGLRELMIGGIGVSHPLLGGAAFAMDAASRPLEYINKLAEVERIVGKANEGMAKAAKAVFTPGMKAVGKVKAPLAEKMFIPDTKQHKKIKNDLSQLNHNQELLMDALNYSTGELHGVAPNMTFSVQQALMRGTQFLESKLPGQVATDPFSPEYEPSKTELAQFQRYHLIVEHPMLAMEQIKEGTLVPETVETMAMVYPKLYETMKASLLDQAIQQKSKDEPIPYRIKQQISMFIGAPIDSALKQQSIFSNQVAFLPKNVPMQQPGPSKDGMKKVTLAERTDPEQDHMES